MKNTDTEKKNFFNSLKQVCEQEKWSYQNILKELAQDDTKIPNFFMRGSKSKTTFIPSNFKSLMELRNKLKTINKSLIVGIGNSKGGTGKSTTALNIAYALSRIGLKTLIVDGDPHQASITLAYGQANNNITKNYNILKLINNYYYKYVQNKDINEVLETNSIEQKELIKKSIISLHYNLDLMPTKWEDTIEIDILEKERGQESVKCTLYFILQQIKNQYDIIITDTSATAKDLSMDMNIISFDEIILMNKNENLSLNAIKKILEPIQTNKNLRRMIRTQTNNNEDDLSILGAVLNEVKNTNIDKDQQAEAEKIFEKIPAKFLGMLPSSTEVKKTYFGIGSILNGMFRKNGIENNLAKSYVRLLEDILLELVSKHKNNE